MHRMRTLAIAGLLGLTVAACAEPLTPREEGALIGAGVGAITGAMIGDAVQESRHGRWEPQDRSEGHEWHHGHHDHDDD